MRHRIFCATTRRGLRWGREYVRSGCARAPLVQPLMRAKPPRTWVDRKLLSANCLACAHLAGPNHVSGDDVKAHGIKDFGVVRNLGPLRHRSPPVQRPSNQPCAAGRVWLQLGNGSIREEYGEPTILPREFAPWDPAVPSAARPQAPASRWSTQYLLALDGLCR
jgi:hypothetical protein